jgi:hypothetical protein
LSNIPKHIKRMNQPIAHQFNARNHVPTQRQEPFALVHALDVFGDIAENVYVEKE